MINNAIFIIFPPLVFLFQNASAPDNWFEKYGWAIVLVLVTNGFQFFLNRKKTGSEVNKIDADTIASLIVTIHKIQETNDSLFQKVQFLRRALGMLDEVVDLLIKIKLFLQGKPDAKEIRREITEAISAILAAEKEKVGG